MNEEIDDQVVFEEGVKESMQTQIDQQLALISDLRNRVDILEGP